MTTRRGEASAWRFRRRAVAKRRPARDKRVGGSGNGVPLGEDSAIDAGAHLGNDSGVEERVKLGGVVDGQQWWTRGVATRRRDTGEEAGFAGQNS